MRIGQDGSVVVDLTPLVRAGLTWLSSQWGRFIDDCKALYVERAPVKVTVRKVCDLDSRHWYYDIGTTTKGTDYLYTHHTTEGGAESVVTKEEFDLLTKGMPGFFHKGGALVPLHLIRP